MAMLIGWEESKPLLDSPTSHPNALDSMFIETPKAGAKRPNLLRSDALEKTGNYDSETSRMYDQDDDDALDGEDSCSLFDGMSYMEDKTSTSLRGGVYIEGDDSQNEKRGWNLLRSLMRNGNLMQSIKTYQRKLPISRNQKGRRRSSTENLATLVEALRKNGIIPPENEILKNDNSSAAKRKNSRIRVMGQEREMISISNSANLSARSSSKLPHLSRSQARQSNIDKWIFSGEPSPERASHIQFHRKSDEISARKTYDSMDSLPSDFDINSPSNSSKRGLSIESYNDSTQINQPLMVTSSIINERKSNTNNELIAQRQIDSDLDLLYSQSDGSRKASRAVLPGLNTNLHTRYLNMNGSSSSQSKDCQLAAEIQYSRLSDDNNSNFSGVKSSAGKRDDLFVQQEGKHKISPCRPLLSLRPAAVSSLSLSPKATTKKPSNMTPPSPNLTSSFHPDIENSDIRDKSRLDGYNKTWGLGSAASSRLPGCKDLKPRPLHMLKSGGIGGPVHSWVLRDYSRPSVAVPLPLLRRIEEERRNIYMNEANVSTLNNKSLLPVLDRKSASHSNGSDSAKKSRKQSGRSNNNTTSAGTNHVLPRIYATSASRHPLNPTTNNQNLNNIGANGHGQRHSPKKSKTKWNRRNIIL